MILNLHGLNGRHDNANYHQLLHLFPDEELYSPQIDYLTEKPEDLLGKLAAHGPYSLVVGNSLGGFFAYALGAREGYPTVLTNPCVPPHEYILGLEDGYRFRDEMESIWNAVYPGDFHCSVIVGTRDEVIDHWRTLELLEPCHKTRTIECGHYVSGAEYEASFKSACDEMRTR